MTASCARRTFAAATSFIAEVIFFVEFTDAMRSRISFWDALWTCHDVKRFTVKGYGIEGQSTLRRRIARRENFGKKYPESTKRFSLFRRPGS